MASHKLFPRSLTVYFNSSVTSTNQTLLGAACWKLRAMFDEWSIYKKLRLKSTFRIVKPRV